MINKKFLIIPVLIFAAAFCFAQEEPADSGDAYHADDWWTEERPEDQENESSEEDHAGTTAEAGEPAEQAGATAEAGAPAEQAAAANLILNNPYFQKSVQLKEQANEAFEEGDYEASTAYAKEAAEYAQRSDDYVYMRLAEAAFARAQSRYTWAVSIGASRRYPAEYKTASAAYNEAVNARKAENWGITLTASNRVLMALANAKGTGGDPGPVAEPIRPAATKGALPAQYTVRHWIETGDCFSAIAGWAWVYGDPHQWRKLYEANRNKLPQPNNPNLILPGMILEIPSLKGETRSGMWDPSAKY